MNLQNYKVKDITNFMYVNCEGRTFELSDCTGDYVHFLEGNGYEVPEYIDDINVQDLAEFLLDGTEGTLATVIASFEDGSMHTITTKNHIKF